MCKNYVKMKRKKKIKKKMKKKLERFVKWEKLLGVQLCIQSAKLNIYFFTATKILFVMTLLVGQIR